MEEKELLAGTIVHIHGYPVELVNHTRVRTFTGHWPLIEASRQAEAKAIDRAASGAIPEEPR